MIDKYPPLTDELKNKYADICILPEISKKITEFKKRVNEDGSITMNLHKIPIFKFGRAEVYAIDHCGPSNLWRILGTVCCWVLSQEDSILEIVEY